MSLESPRKNKMTTAAPAKKEYHFSGDGIWHNMTILAQDIDEAATQWLELRRLVIPAQSTSATEDLSKEGI
jgi:hypothetical protein